ncbi:MAG: nucleotidyl transferase AbiEii/AbiGii toxin family protein [Coriobacteriia bacterium]|nr:nucleotidyl transferase AbiEii/AbiGii toxin family protein [Coriobacteriia bacterium]
MTKTPNSRRNLDIAIERAFGTGDNFLRTRTLIANTIVGQMLPSGVVKGGSSLKFRWGNENARFTNDLDTVRGTALTEFEEQMAELLEKGWHDFTGRLVARAPATPEGVPTQYVMQPFEVKLSYKGKAWLTVILEIGHDEIGDAYEPEYTISESIVQIFSKIGLPSPAPMPCMALHHQISQKLHGLSEENSSRAHDLIDLQLIVKNENIDYAATRQACVRLFAYRNLQAWPPIIKKKENWGELYDAQKNNLSVLDSVDESVVWTNKLIKRIDAVA